MEQCALFIKLARPRLNFHSLCLHKGSFLLPPNEVIFFCVSVSVAVLGSVEFSVSVSVCVSWCVLSSFLCSCLLWCLCVCVWLCVRVFMCACVCVHALGVRMNGKDML